MALPKPKYPSPGEPWPSLEAEDPFNSEYEIYRKANLAFQDLLQFILSNPDEDHPRYSDESVLRAAENRKFLGGLWLARGYKAPTWDELVALAQKRAPTTPEEVPQKSQLSSTTIYAQLNDAEATEAALAIDKEMFECI